MISSEISPAAASFLRQQHAPRSPETIFRDYAHFLLHASGAWELPVPLERIRDRFKFQRKAAPLPQRGFLFGNAIFINSDDALTVQRFTEAHEMMETLFVALRSEAFNSLLLNAQHKLENEKEQWCESGAAELLMPAELFYLTAAEYGITLNAARTLARLCHTSLTATIRRMLEADTEPCLFALLKQGHKKSQLVPSKVGQGVLWGNPQEWDPPAELRVWKRWSSPQVDRFLCINESFSHDNLAFEILRSGTAGVIRSSQDVLDLEYIQGEYWVETMLVSMDKTPIVMILIHL